MSRAFQIHLTDRLTQLLLPPY